MCGAAPQTTSRRRPRLLVECGIPEHQLVPTGDANASLIASRSVSVAASAAASTSTRACATDSWNSGASYVATHCAYGCDGSASSTSRAEAASSGRPRRRSRSRAVLPLRRPGKAQLPQSPSDTRRYPRQACECSSLPDPAGRIPPVRSPREAQIPLSLPWTRNSTRSPRDCGSGAWAATRDNAFEYPSR